MPLGDKNARHFNKDSNSGLISVDIFSKDNSGLVANSE